MIRRLPLASVAFVVLAACQQPVEPAPPTTSQAEVSPPTTPAAAAAVDPNVLTPDGLGAVRIGMTADEVAAAWGPDANPEAVGGADPAACDQHHPARSPAGVTVMIEEGRLTRITLMRDATVKTERGFGLGDTGAAIKAAYGGGVVAQPHKYEPAPAEDLFVWARGGSTNYVTDPTARGVRYEVGGDGKVKMIHAGGPSIQLVEGCS